MKFAAILLFTAATVFATAVEARRDTRSYSGFSTGTCKRASCFAKHPGGHYVYPHHSGRRH
ncbi:MULTISPECIES: hypothetical protein [unclassified Rhizobium]|uniref:hypothetical protein n=1 Tax=unclassified Rhizobium TaxID=2613769 RepID=UPI001ADB5F54|nr:MULTISPECIES: hypothetical protein [unclassified Rhizobium]MBO9100331.1 hypothetical protein [Rhizobium sp. L58/93]MBO9186224.1 hypothetical protein [Rhizobium sp. E27B/91]QXZ83143.1 hypothetical protein J5287_13820 [Rhizobium sp. K1/93]QXZ89345.1 hypothetical protein J5280_14770 [Rhizobium sp. K15/93]QYA01933.1 hypothetical protein J5278_01710 [Rhizobium sp. B21/90]